MSVMKIKWKEMCRLLSNHVNSWDNKFKPLLQECDTKLSIKIGNYTQTTLYDAFKYVVDFILKYYSDPDDDTNIWRNVDLFVSSHKVEDLRIMHELENRLYQYLGFYSRILSDDGVARKLVSRRTYSSEGDNTGDYKNYESETPQIGLNNFDDAINYASRLEKNEDSRHTEKSGSSDYELKSFNWDEALRNMKMVFYNDLVRYINSIPKLIYDYYALEQYPVSYTIEQYFKTLKDLYARR